MNAQAPEMTGTDGMPLTMKKKVRASVSTASGVGQRSPPRVSGSLGRLVPSVRLWRQEPLLQEGASTAGAIACHRDAARKDIPQLADLHATHEEPLPTPHGEGGEARIVMSTLRNWSFDFMALSAFISEAFDLHHVHIPDGFLDTKTLVTTATLSAGGIGVAWREAQSRLTQGRIPLLGVSAAFIFAAQMVNFPVAFGTSGHLIGGVLAATLLGAGPAVIVMTTVILTQCLVFADGGLFALGANVFNMAIVGTLTGYAIYRLLHRIFRGARGRVIAVAVASWCSVVLSSLCCAGELAWSGAASAATVFPAMAGVHALIGIGEALVTGAVIAAIERARPDLLALIPDPQAPRSRIPVPVYGLVVAAGLLLFVFPFASRWPDGLNKVARTLGFDQSEVARSFPAPFAGYQLPGTGGSVIATIIVGIIGLLMVFFLTAGLVRLFAGKTEAASRPNQTR